MRTISEVVLLLCEQLSINTILNHSLSVSMFDILEVTQGEVSEELQQGDQEWRRGDQ